MKDKKMPLFIIKDRNHNIYAYSSIISGLILILIPFIFNSNNTYAIGIGIITIIGARSELKKIKQIDFYDDLIKYYKIKNQNHSFTSEISTISTKNIDQIIKIDNYFELSTVKYHENFTNLKKKLYLAFYYVAYPISVFINFFLKLFGIIKNFKIPALMLIDTKSHNFVVIHIDQLSNYELENLSNYIKLKFLINYKDIKTEKKFINLNFLELGD